MLFNSFDFLFGFLPLALVLFFVVGRYSGKAARWVLALLSLAFYAYWDLRFLPLLVGSILGNYVIGVATANWVAQGRHTAARLACTVGIVANLALLGFFKYANFFADVARSAGAFPWDLPHIVLPIGISFFTFTQIAYLVDALKGKAKEYNLGDYTLFVSYFPHQIAGPILHHGEMMSQFRALQQTRWSLQHFQAGLSVLAIGLVKKILFADPLGDLADPVFEAAQHHNAVQFAEAWGATLAYSLQLYFDFSAYSDMAIGISMMLGIRLPLNFDSPYKSTSIIEFWQRWHMTLSRFLRDYLYIPLGGNRKGHARRYLNLFVTMALGGLWHGASWNFLLWGALHGLYLSVNHAWRSFSDRLFPAGQPSPFPARAAAWLLTFLAVAVAWVFFRAPTLDGAFHMLSVMAGLEGIALPPALAQALPGGWGFVSSAGWLGSFPLGRGGLLVGTLMLACLVLPNAQQMFRLHQPALLHQPVVASGNRLVWQPTLAWALLIAVGAGIALSRLGNDSQFLYFNF
jgi:D-alanyl-lipoteichoic acid acyltransferase DltB (MBOAT superfamily)